MAVKTTRFSVLEVKDAEFADSKANVLIESYDNIIMTPKI